MRLFPRRQEEAPAAGLTRTDLEHAYDRGRRDERKRHHSHPILGLIIAAAAILGAGAVYLGFHEGSFSRAGQVVDSNLAVAADRTQVASQTAAQKVADAGSAAQQAGQNLRQTDGQQQPQTRQY
jgi:hypothetical protein